MTDIPIPSGNAFLAALAPYRDRFGFPSGSLSPHDPSGNCLMFLAEEMLILRDQGLLRFQDVARFSALVGLCQLEIGNFRRTPLGCQYSTDQEGQDDFIGLAAASHAIGTSHAFQIHFFGRRCFFRWRLFRMRFAYPTRMPAMGTETRSAAEWIGRSPAFVAHATWAAGKRPNWLYRLGWCWGVAFAGWTDPTAQDPWRISYLMARTTHSALGGRVWNLEHLAVRLWTTRLLRHWPGGMPQVRKRYFGDPVHPLAVWMKENA